MTDTPSAGQKSGTADEPNRTPLSRQATDVHVRPAGRSRGDRPGEAPGDRVRVGGTSGAVIWGLVRSLRPRQWLKNGVVLAGIVFARELGDPDRVARAVIAAALFCLLSGAVYLVNDVLDREKDQHHPVKSRRPIAAGVVPPALALAAALVIAIGALASATMLAPAFGATALAYLILQALYVAVMKHIVILDVLAVASGFVLRAAAGALAIDVPISPWLYVVTLLLALFLVLGKRRQELVLLTSDAANHRDVLRDYSLPFVDQLLSIVTTALLVSYMLYTFFSENLPRSHAMMLTIPFPLYGIFRYLYLIHVRGDGGAPEEVLLRDRPLAWCCVAWVVASIAVVYLG